MGRLYQSVKVAMGIYPKVGVSLETIKSYLKGRNTPDGIIDLCMWYINCMRVENDECTRARMLSPKLTWQIRNGRWLYITSREQCDIAIKHKMSDVYGNIYRYYRRDIYEYLSEMKNMGYRSYDILDNHDKYVTNDLFTFDDRSVLVIVSTLLNEAVDATFVFNDYNQSLLDDKVFRDAEYLAEIEADNQRAEDLIKRVELEKACTNAVSRELQRLKTEYNRLGVCLICQHVKEYS